MIEYPMEWLQGPICNGRICWHLSCWHLSCLLIREQWVLRIQIRWLEMDS